MPTLLPVQNMPTPVAFNEIAEGGTSEYRFPTSISYGSSGGPNFKSTIFTSSNGKETIRPAWNQMRATFTVSMEDVDTLQMEELYTFFLMMRGMACGFRFKDWNDYTISNQPLMVGDGVTDTVQLFKRYAFGPSTYDRIIRKPVRRSFTELVVGNGELSLNDDFSVNWRTGLITFDEPPASGRLVILPYAEFDVPVRFDSDELIVSIDDFDSYSAELDLIEIIPNVVV